MEKLLEFALSAGASRAVPLSVSQIPFHREFREACAQNSCGKYGSCWMCPPDVGEIDTLIASAKSFHDAVFFQTISPLEDSFDIEGMEAAARHHNQVCKHFFSSCSTLLERYLPLGAGGCHLCAVCARISGEVCRYPAQAFASLEAYGIAVAELAEICGLSYLNGENTVTYFGALLF